MTTELELAALDGTNPLGFLAAVGVLDVLHRAGRAPTMRWTDDLVPVPVVTGTANEVDLVGVLDVDRAGWRDNLVLRGPAGDPLTDIKPRPPLHRRWVEEMLDTLEEGRAQADLLCALLSEGAVDGKGNAKPTHLHFTAGRQQFLSMARELARGADAERLGEAVFGPWRQDSPLPSLRWNSQGERLYALRAVNPEGDKLLGVPGADWLALLGLTFFPTRVMTPAGGDPILETTGCDRAWKRSKLRWPLWTPPLDRDTAWSLVGAKQVVGQDPRMSHGQLATLLSARGILRVLQAPIRRSDEGGYGSFGGAAVLVEAGKGTQRTTR